MMMVMAVVKIKKGEIKKSHKEVEEENVMRILRRMGMI